VTRPACAADLDMNDDKLDSMEHNKRVRVFNSGSLRFTLMTEDSQP